MSDWRDEARCRNEDPELFFPLARGGSWSEEYQRQVDSAKAVCALCPVAADCLEFAMVNEPDGVWAGTTKDERKELAKESAA